MQMAVDAWNKKGGAMGRQVVLMQEDSAADPGVAVQKARKLVNQDKCVALIGSVSSAVSLSVGGAANSMGVLFMDTGGHSDDITMKDCHWSTFQICHPTWMLTHATGYAFSKYGKKWYAITPDYAYGHSIMNGYQDIAKQVGATFIGNDLTPLGTSDFGAYLPKLAASGADVFVCNLGGNDFVNCMKQAASYGIFKKMKAGGPLAELENFWASPPDARVGYWGIEWYYNGASVLGNKKTAHEFVDGNAQAHRFAAFSAQCIRLPRHGPVAQRHRTSPRRPTLSKLQKRSKARSSTPRSSKATRTSAPTITR